MSDGGLSKIYTLTGCFLKPFTDKKPFLVTKENEKDILVSMTKVSRGIRELTKGLRHGDSCILSGRDLDCLAEIVTIIGDYLSVSSPFVQHSAGNILVAVSDFLIMSGNDWERFLHLLLVTLDAELVNISSSSSVSHWQRATGLVKVLRNILKSLKQRDGEHGEGCIHSFCSSLSRVSWGILDRVFKVQSDGILVSQTESDLVGHIIDFQHLRNVFLGTLLQLFCSLGDSGSDGRTIDSSEELTVVTKIGQLLHNILKWCFSSYDNKTSDCFSHYFRHKILVLMLRLSCLCDQQCSVLISWLQWVKKYMADLLEPHFYHRRFYDSLEGSPFIALMVSGERVNVCTHHLQRQAIILLFGCSFSLIVGEKCTCTTTSDTLIQVVGTGSSNCYLIALSELSEWLQRQVPLRNGIGYETYAIELRNFAGSFLHLFIDEDDLLFKILLLLSSPMPVKFIKCKKNNLSSDEVKRDALFVISSTFNPVYLFHLFLAEIQYDHSVLLDYLISTDTGVLCLQYLLRCLRIVCESWDVFLGFWISESVDGRPCRKKRKLPEMDEHEPNGQVELSSLSRETDTMSSGVGIPIHLRQKAFLNAKECLLSLKQSIMNLHEKKLFPYNASALLRSLKRFEDICGQSHA